MNHSTGHGLTHLINATSQGDKPALLASASSPCHPRRGIVAGMLGGSDEPRVVVFDVGETLVDETRSWSALADAAGVTALTLFGALGVLIERR